MEEDDSLIRRLAIVARILQAEEVVKEVLEEQDEEQDYEEKDALSTWKEITARMGLGKLQ